MLAALCNLSEACSILLDGGADAGATDLNGNTALHLAYAFGSMSSALILEEKGADTNTTNASGRTASEEAGRFLHFCKIFDYPQKDSD
jgi:ankyrin repeat protein